jgi:hypothetical protein
MRTTIRWGTRDPQRPRRGLAALAALALGATGFAPVGVTVPGELVSGIELGQLVELTGSALGPGTLASPNVEYLGTIPLDAPGVGGAVREHAVTGQTLFFTTGLKGLTIYDVADPAAPVLVGMLAFPHSQNEDVSVSDDGTRVVISADGALAVPIMPHSRGIHVVDTTDPTTPTLVASHPDSNHTTECADPDCEWLYGSTTGGIYDARRAHEGVIERTERDWNVLPDGTVVGGRHALNLDEAGLLISDSNPRLVLDPRPHLGPDGTVHGPHHPRLLAWGERDDDIDPRLQHNNWRPGALEWTPRRHNKRGPVGRDAYVEPDGPGVLPPGSLRAGELLIANSESNLNPNCSMAGGLSTWDLRDFDKGRAPVELEVFRPVNGTWVDGDPALNALGCSGHWFTVRDQYVTASWYEHGVRFFEVGLDTGSIEEIGFFQPVATEAGAAIWIDDEHVYAVDYARGIDILRFDRDGERPSEGERVASWLASRDRVGVLSAEDRFACRLATVD